MDNKKVKEIGGEKGEIQECRWIECKEKACGKFDSIKVIEATRDGDERKQRV